MCQHCAEGVAVGGGPLQHAPQIRPPRAPIPSQRLRALYSNKYSQL
jgi:hypothetical protein